MNTLTLLTSSLAKRTSARFQKWGNPKFMPFCRCLLFWNLVPASNGPRINRLRILLLILLWATPSLHGATGDLNLSLQRSVKYIRLQPSRRKMIFQLPFSWGFHIRSQEATILLPSSKAWATAIWRNKNSCRGRPPNYPILCFHPHPNPARSWNWGKHQVLSILWTPEEAGDPTTNDSFPFLTADGLFFWPTPQGHRMV